MNSQSCDISMQLWMLVGTSVLTLLVFIIRDWIARKEDEEKILKSSRIQLSFFTNVLITAILNNNKSLAIEHYRILLGNLSIIAKDEKLRKTMQKLEDKYLALQIENFLDKQEREQAIKDLEEIKNSLK